MRSDQLACEFCGSTRFQLGAADFTCNASLASHGCTRYGDIMRYKVEKMTTMRDVLDSQEPKLAGPGLDHDASKPLSVSEQRKAQPITRGCLDYFPDALLAVAELSLLANQKHNPGEPLHWSKDKSSDHADCLVRHLIARGTWDYDLARPVRHSTEVAWRALALLQIEID